MVRPVPLLSDPPHPWWRHLPPERRTRHQRARLLWRRLKAWLQRRRQRQGLTVALYVALCAVPLLLGLPALALVALLPLLMVPPVGLLIYWLVWKEFHH